MILILKRGKVAHDRQLSRAPFNNEFLSDSSTLLKINCGIGISESPSYAKSH